MNAKIIPDDAATRGSGYIEEIDSAGVQTPVYSRRISYKVDNKKPSAKWNF